mgnify:FL=1
MITEKDLQEAIAECQAVENPNANTCIKLAAFLTIKNELYGQEDGYSYSGTPEEFVNYYSDTDFGQAIDGKNAIDMWAIMDEMMDALRVLNPRLYDGVLRKIKYL